MVRLLDENGHPAKWVRVSLLSVSIFSWMALLPAAFLAVIGTLFAPLSFGWQPTFEWLLILELPALAVITAICTAIGASGRLRALLAGAILVIGIPAISALFFLT